MITDLLLWYSTFFWGRWYHTYITFCIWLRHRDLERLHTMVDAKDFFASNGPTESNRYKLTEVIGKGSYGIVASAVDQFNSGKIFSIVDCI